MKSESAELVSGLIRQYRRLRLLYLGYLAAAVLALVFFVDKRVTWRWWRPARSTTWVVVREGGKAYQRAFVHACGQCVPRPGAFRTPATPEAPTLEEGGAAPRPPGRRQRRQGLCPGEGGRPGTYHGRRERLGDAGLPILLHGKPTTSSWAPGYGGAREGHWAELAAHPRAGDDEAIPGRHAGRAGRAAGGGASAPAGWEDGTFWFAPPPGRRATRRASGDAFSRCPVPAVRRHPIKPPGRLRPGETVSMSLSPNRILGQKVSSRVSPSAAVAEVDFLRSWTEFSRPRTPWYKNFMRQERTTKTGKGLVAHEVYAHMGRPGPCAF